MDLNALKENKNQLICMQREVEPVADRNQHSSGANAGPGYSFRPTYRAMIAQKGFLVQQTLGSGTYSKVKKALNFTSHIKDTHVALKIIDRTQAPQDYQRKFLPREVILWPKLQHSHLITLHDIFQDPYRVFMVLEFAPGGDCLQYIQKYGAVAERIARTWTAQVSDAVRYMHDKNIVHRDLKLENLLLDAHMNIKICDFGFVKQLTGDRDFSKTYCGSKSYAAPEILMGTPYNAKKSDVWAIGVILYIFVTGKMPFDETKGTKSILKEQKSLDFRWLRCTQQVSPQCVNLILYIFTWRFQDRPDILQVTSHSWFKSSQAKSIHNKSKFIGDILGIKSLSTSKSKSLDCSTGQTGKRRGFKFQQESVSVTSPTQDSPPRKIPTPPKTAPPIGPSAHKIMMSKVPSPPKGSPPRITVTRRHNDRQVKNKSPAQNQGS